jgi:hypothetical protein
MNLRGRIDKLEAANDSGTTVYGWRNFEETHDQAVARYRATHTESDPDTLIVIGWNDGNEQPDSPS